MRKRNQKQSLPTRVSPKTQHLAPYNSSVTSTTLTESVKFTVCLFADDCLLYSNIRYCKGHDNLQGDLRQLPASLGLYLWNAILMIKMLHYDHEVLPTGQPHTAEDPRKLYLGVTLSENLKWSSNITKLTNKANSILWFLRRNLKHSLVITSTHSPPWNTELSLILDPY